VVLTVVFQWSSPLIVQAMLGMDSIAPRGEIRTARQAWVELSSLVGILTVPLVSLVVALLYLKARQLGGETLEEVMARADGDAGLAEWERRMRVRLRGSRSESMPEPDVKGLPDPGPRSGSTR